MPGMFELYGAVVVAALGVGGIVLGLSMFARLPRTQIELERWLHNLRYVGGANFTMAQFDQTALGLLARYQRRIAAIVLVGAGAGALTSMVVSLGFWWFASNAHPELISQSPWSSLFYGPLALGITLGIGLSALLSVAVSGATNRDAPLPVAAPSSRPAGASVVGLFYALMCAIFLFCVTLMALIATNVLPTTLFTDNITGAHPPIWVLLLAPGFISVTILMAGLFTLFVSRSPLPANGLEPAVALQAQALYRNQIIVQLWNPLTYMGMLLLLVSESSYAPGMLSIALQVVGMVGFVAGFAHFLWRTTTARAPIRVALALAAAAHQRGQNA